MKNINRILSFRFKAFRKIAGAQGILDKKKEPVTPAVEEKKEKPTPAFLKEDYPYKATGGQKIPIVAEDFRCLRAEIIVELV